MRLHETTLVIFSRRTQYHLLLLKSPDAFSTVMHNSLDAHDESCILVAIPTIVSVKIDFQDTRTRLRRTHDLVTAPHTLLTSASVADCSQPTHMLAGLSTCSVSMPHQPQNPLRLSQKNLALLPQAPARRASRVRHVQTGFYWRSLLPGPPLLLTPASVSIFARIT